MSVDIWVTDFSVKKMRVWSQMSVHMGDRVDRFDGCCVCAKMELLGVGTVSQNR